MALLGALTVHHALATDRAVEMERLVTFGQALAHSLDEDAIRDVVVAHVPLLLPGRGAWVTIAEPADPETGDGIVWPTLTVAGDSSVESRERAHAVSSAKSP